MAEFSPASTARSMQADRSTGFDTSMDMEQIFQTLLLNRTLSDGESSEGSSSGLPSARSGPAEALRELRRTTPLRELSGEAFTRLLAGTLYEYDSSAPPTPLTTPGGPLVGSSAEVPRGGGDMDTTLGLLETAIEEEYGSDTHSPSGTGVFVPDAAGERGESTGHEPLMVSFAADSEGSASPSPSSAGLGTARSGDDSRAPSLWSTARSEARSDGFWRTARTVFGDTSSFLVGDRRPPPDGEVDATVTAHVHEMLRLLSGDGDLDENLVQSARRMVQLGAVASGQRLSDEDIAALPKVSFEQAEHQTCSICLESYQHGEMLTALRCTHFFHTSCVTRWFQRSTQCPLCRTVQSSE